MQRTGQTLPCQAPSRPSYIPGHSSLNRRCNTRTLDGKAFRILTIIDEHTRECLALVVKRSITSQDVLERLYMLFLVRGVPEHIRLDNGPEFTSRAVRGWLSNLGVKAMFIEPGSPW